MEILKLIGNNVEFSSENLIKIREYINELEKYKNDNEVLIKSGYAEEIVIHNKFEKYGISETTTKTKVRFLTEDEFAIALNEKQKQELIKSEVEKNTYRSKIGELSTEKVKLEAEIKSLKNRSLIQRIINKE